MEQPFKLPTLGELKTLTKVQLLYIFFELENHRAKQLLVASSEYEDVIEKINAEYNSNFQVLSDVLAELKEKSG